MEQREVGILLGLKVVNGDALKIGNDEVPRAIFALPGFLQPPDIFHRLRMGFVQVLARALVFNDERTRPKKIDAAPMTGELLYRLLKTGNHPALDAEDIEIVIPKGLSLGGLAGFSLPLL